MSGNARLNWAEVRERLSRVQQAIDETALHSSETRDRIYRMRAELLARPVSHREDSESEEIMIVRIGGARYGIALPEIAEVTGGSTCAPVPGAPPEVAGLIQVRGEVRPVLNAGHILGVSEDDSGATLTKRRWEPCIDVSRLWPPRNASSYGFWFNMRSSLDRPASKPVRRSASARAGRPSDVIASAPQMKPAHEISSTLVSISISIPLSWRVVEPCRHQRRSSRGRDVSIQVIATRHAIGAK